MELPDSLWLEEYGTTEDCSGEESSDEEDPGSPENNEENTEENSPDDRRSRSPTRPLPSPSPTPVQSPRVRRRSRSPTPEADHRPDYTRVLSAAMDAILRGDATEQDYARAASAAFLIPMHGQQDAPARRGSVVRTDRRPSTRRARLSARAPSKRARAIAHTETRNVCAEPGHCKFPVCVVVNNTSSISLDPVSPRRRRVLYSLGGQEATLRATVGIGVERSQVRRGSRKGTGRGDAFELGRVVVTRENIAHNSPPARAEQ